MASRTATNTACYALLALTGIATFMLPKRITPGVITAYAAPTPSRQLRGVVRDFSTSHPDFHGLPAVGSGHVAGTVGRQLDGDGRPTWSPRFHEFLVSQGRIVPQRAFAVRHGVMGAAIVSNGVPVPVTMRVHVGDDTFEPFGAFDSPVAGNVNVDRDPVHEVLPATYPADTPVSIAARSWLLTDNGLDGTQDGHYAVYLEASSLEDSPQVIALRNGDAVPDIAPLQDQASIAEFVGDYIDSETGTITLDENEIIYLFELGTTDLDSAAADFQDLVILVSLANNPASFVTGGDDPVAGFHVASPWLDAESRPIAPHLYDDTLADETGAAGAGSDAGVSSAESFDQWFRDVPGVNMSGPLALKLTESADGVHEYLSDAFFPADGRLLGNEDASHNRHFTTTLGATFTYEAGTGQFVHFEGGDGAWVFIGGQLAIDLGGYQTEVDQYADLDRLGLVDGEAYELQVLYAHRSPQAPAFRFRTNVVLQASDSPVTVSAMFD